MKSEHETAPLPPPGWYQRIKEVSNGVYRVLQAADGRQVSSTGPDVDVLRRQCVADAWHIERSMRR
ncbi:hypothetical protein [Hymenobacter weizhouensis]|uniref:hypothetical protein n=1 Tax=Hymenobacter sp. YIM 151500-1 TaxID=2987689 RepID=UPI0022280423|nr:hypothetical protein [Hymenobacter sp. YIM 151500-1]UYZ63498.1 hypothetical protein OIS53_01335 [Hymenobacter sp. YIM 151500-1]